MQKPIFSKVTSASVPLCSVVIPTHNCLAYLKLALQSVWLQHGSWLQQERELEVLVVNDNSSDGTQAWLEQQAQAKPIRVFQTEGIGPARARNLAIQQAKGEFIAFLDADDIWQPHKLEQQLCFMQNLPGVVMSFTDYRHFSEAGEDRGTCFDFWPSIRSQLGGSHAYRVLPKAAELLLADNPVGTSCVVARRDALLKLGGFDEQLPSAEDWDLWLKLAQYGMVACSTQESMHYLMRAGSESSKNDLRQQAMQAIYQRHAGQIASHLSRSCRHARARMLTLAAETAEQRRSWLSALGYRVAALGLRPSIRAFKEALAVCFSACPYQIPD